MKDWLDALQACRDDNIPCVLVTVIETQGSTPRASGAKMLVTETGIAGTVGGGKLEYQATLTARELIRQGGPTQIRRFPAGSDPERCGGASTALLFEPFQRNDFNIFLFGAGHVGKALVHVLAPLPCRIAWIDSREALLPRTLPTNVRRVLSETPQNEAAAAPPDTVFLVMTPSHDQDFRICEKVLERGDFAYLGLLGSADKRRQFEQRMMRQGMTGEALRRLVCPIGIAGISGRDPAEIAIAVAAEILQAREQRRPLL